MTDTFNAYVALCAALNNLVGSGAQHQRTCDPAGHADGNRCIWCEARDALSLSQKNSTPTDTTHTRTARQADVAVDLDTVVVQIDELATYASEQFEAFKPGALTNLGLDVLAERIQALARMTLLCRSK
jgi:hypothetical protein